MTTIVIEGKTLKINDTRLLELNSLCSQFVQKSLMFDEIIIAYISDNSFFHTIYRYPLERKAHLGQISRYELQKILDEIDLISLDKWDYVSTAEGTDFDIVCKITDTFFILINNTEMSIDELYVKWRKSHFDNVAYLIKELMIDIKKNLLSWWIAYIKRKIQSSFFHKIEWL